MQDDDYVIDHQVCGLSQRALVMKEWDLFQPLGKESAKLVIILPQNTVTGDSLSFLIVIIGLQEYAC